MAGRASSHWRGIRRFRSNFNPNRRLRIDDLGETLFGIGNRNHYDRKSFFIAAPAVAAGSLLSNEVLICPSTFKRNRLSMGRA